MATLFLGMKNLGVKSKAFPRSLTHAVGEGGLS